MDVEQEERVVVIPGVSWETFVGMDALLQDSPVRMKFCDEQVEIMSPISRRHEQIKSNIGCMVELFCRRRGLFFHVEGSATLRKKYRRSGEPDESYIFTRGRKKAELVIETALTSGGVDKLEFYRVLEIPEVWIWRDGGLEVYRFETGRYLRRKKSTLLPGIDVALIGRLAAESYTSDALDAFDKTLQ